MATNLRFQVVEEAFKKRPLEVEAPKERPSEFFGKYVFTREKMFKYLPKDVYLKLVDVMDNGARLDRSIADAAAAGMKQWAQDMGATHYTHWFQPLTEGTAEKHEAFVEFDGKGGMMENFSGKLLVQQEPDASSFPSGGIRNTFEARGYSAWDPTSPVFIIDDTLCIPTIFIAYTGEALDYKAPLLRSLHAVGKAATEVCSLFYDNVTKVSVNLGWEQEYFLVDEGLYSARPDLMLTGRTLMGHESAKNQQMDDHYFGTIPDRVQAFMKDLEVQALELSIPVKTRHNEVAPNQFELAPIFEECNLAVDHNMLLMSLMKRVARKHGFRVLLHEKPFDGINGSGKHCNWSLTADNGVLLHAPGKNSGENLRFASFIVETLMAVYKHNGLLKASIMSATNAHRLGGNEAPPSIISSFLGKYVSELLDHIEDGKDFQSSQSASSAEAGKQKPYKGEIDIPQIPDLIMDNTDRNRTSPFAFTGNRFEFRAPGSSVNCASAMIALNTAMAEALTSFKKRVDQRITEYSAYPEYAEGTGHTAKYHAIIDVLRDDIKASKPVRFDGNGYSEEWVIEAERRGLDVCKSCPVIIEHYLDEDTVKMFEDMKVMNRKELQARNEVKWEMYVKTVQIEARVLGDLAMNHIIPVSTHYQSQLIKNVQGMKNVFSDEKSNRLSARNMKLIEEIAERTERIEYLVEELTDARRVANRIQDIHQRAIAYHDTVCPQMEKIRQEADHLEMIVEDGLWTLPKYRELLFIR
ncbi:MAG: glutamine synthetase III [Prevotella sp.]|nr:glutamine synthetase III [Prevotella sp.]